MIFSVDELLKRHPLPLTPDGKPFVPNQLQREDVETCIPFSRTGLFLPVGYGKTVVSTLIALAWGDQHRLVLLPPILIAQWVLWLNGIGNSGGALAYEGSPRERADLPLATTSWWVMSYGVFRNDIEKLRKALTGKTYAVLVDEAQNLKNVGSKLFQGVDSISVGQHLELMTGTELNSPADAYAYIKLKTPTIYRSQAHFENMHVEDRDFFERPTKWRGLNVITDNLYLNSAHRTKEEVHAHLPKANYQVMPYKLSKTHKEVYDTLAEDMLVELESGGKIDGSTEGKLRNTLQQMVINWGHFMGHTEHEHFRPAAFDVLDQVMDEIDVQQVTSSKLIVWTWFQLTSAYVTNYLNEIGVPAVAAYGGANSQKSVKQFMEDPAIRVLVAQPGSAGAGLNPQYICSECIFLEIPTRTIQFRQSAGRIDREGQRFNPNIRIALAEGTVQPAMYSSLLDNDGLVQKTQGSAFDLRKLVYSK